MKKTPLTTLAQIACSMVLVLAQVQATPHGHPTGGYAEILDRDCKNSNYDYFVCDVVNQTCYRHTWSESDCTGPNPTWFWTDICEEAYIPGTCTVTLGVTQVTQVKRIIPFASPTSNCGCTLTGSGQEVINGTIAQVEYYSCVACVLNTLGNTQAHTVSTCTMIQ